MIGLTNAIDKFNEINKLEYIISSGTQYIDTEYVHKATTRIETECCLISNTNSNYQVVFGARYTDYKKNAFVFFNRFYGNNIPCFNRSGNEKRGSGLVYDEFIKIVAEGQTVSWYKDDVLVGSVTSTGTVDAGVTPMMIFNVNTASSSGGVTPDISYSYIKMKSFKIYEGNILVRDYIPYQDENGIYCLYDKVGENCYYNKGTGSFSGSNS